MDIAGGATHTHETNREVEAMYAVAHEAQSGRVTGNGDRAAKIQTRLEALGISDREFAERTGVDRKALRRAANGEPVRGSTYTAIETWLTRLEQENGEGVAPSEEESSVIRLTFHDVYGIGEIIAEGPVDDPDALVASVTKLLREIRER